jgi:hypothetical protein
VLVEVLCGLVQVLKVLVEALSANSSFQIVVDAVKVHEEALRMEITAE